MMNGLFATNNQEATVGGTQLEQSVRLTALSAQIANQIMRAIESSNDEELASVVKESMTSHGATDKLISMTTDLSTVDVEFLKDCDDELLDRMLKSQQSKRSRTKSKIMTVENYTSMLTGAVAENLLRLVSGKAKSEGRTGVRHTDITYTEDELDMLANNQEELKKAIRNIQSKKSIAKSKMNFDPTSERWQQLLVAEEQLKNIRIDNRPRTVKPVEVNSKVNELLASVEDVSSLKAADAKALIEQVKNLLNQ